MTIRGHIKDGVAVLDTPVNLPDGTAVRVEVDETDSAFWRNKSAEELAHEQGVKAIRSADELAGDWPEEDSLEEFLAQIREARR